MIPAKDTTHVLRTLIKWIDLRTRQLDMEQDLLGDIETTIHQFIEGQRTMATEIRLVLSYLASAIDES